MKAVVVEIKNQYVAVLTDDGSIIKVKNKNYALGQEILLNNEKFVISFNNKIATFVVSVAAIAVLGTGTWAYASPYSYVNLDINPSIEFTLNRFNRVLKVEATNEDGNYIIEEINVNKLKNERIEDALSTTVDQISKSGYFNDQDEADLVITASAKNKNTAEKLAKDLYETVDKELKIKGEEVEIQAYSYKIDNNKAKNNKILEQKSDEEKTIDKVEKEDQKSTEKAGNKPDKEEKKDRKSSKEQKKKDRKSIKEQEKKNKEPSKEQEKKNREASREQEKKNKEDFKEQEKKNREASKDEENNKKSSNNSKNDVKKDNDKSDNN